MKPGTAKIVDWAECASCGWPIIHACCNDGMGELHPDSDWWAYCTNQSCKNHAGEDWGILDVPSFVITARSSK